MDISASYMDTLWNILGKNVNITFAFSDKQTTAFAFHGSSGIWLTITWNNQWNQAAAARGVALNLRWPWAGALV